MKHLFSKALPAAVILAIASFAGAQERSITIDTNKTTIKTSPLLYGIFFEEINRAGEGGIYAEMIQNRSFEDKSRVDEVRDTPLAWGAVNAEAKFDRSQPLNKNNITSLKVKTQAGGFVSNGGFVRDFTAEKTGNLAVTGGDSYDLTFYAKTGTKTDLKIAIEDASGVLASESVSRPPCPVQYWYGEAERAARKRDIAYMKKVFPNTVFVENKGQDHAEFFTLHPDEFCDQLEMFILNNGCDSSVDPA